MPDLPDVPHGRPAVGPERVLAALALAAMVVITFANVAVRYLTNYSFASTEEVTVTLMVVLTLLGSAAAVARNSHIRVTFLVDRLPHRLRRPAEAAGLLATLAMFGLLVWYGAQMAWDDYRFEVTSPSLGVPQWIYTAWLPILAAVVCARVVLRLVRGPRR